MTDLEFIKNFSKIRISNICKKLKVQKNNVYSGKTTKENLHKLRKEIEKEYTRLCLEDLEDVKQQKNTL